MDFLSFMAACECLTRVESIEKTEHAWTLMLAAQGDQKGMEDWVGRWRPQSQEKQVKAKNQKFLNKNSKSIKKG